jgi:hypothetical protein
MRLQPAVRRPELSDQWLRIAPLLFDALGNWATSRGAAQIIVVTAHADKPKRAALKSLGLTVASEWWVGAIERSD